MLHVRESLLDWFVWITSIMGLSKSGQNLFLFFFQSLNSFPTRMEIIIIRLELRKMKNLTMPNPKKKKNAVICGHFLIVLRNQFIHYLWRYTATFEILAKLLFKPTSNRLRKKYLKLFGRCLKFEWKHLSTDIFQCIFMLLITCVFFMDNNLNNSSSNIYFVLYRSCQDEYPVHDHMWIK